MLEVIDKGHSSAAHPTALLFVQVATTPRGVGMNISWTISPTTDFVRLR